MIGFITKRVYHLLGWKLVGRYPRELNYLILIVAPHTSNWDFPLGLLVKFWLKIDAKYYAKASLFKWPLGVFMRSIGGRPVDRSKNNDLVGQAVQDFKDHERMHLLFTPEGTRKRTEKFKSGFYYIAVQTGAPILPISFDYEHKTIKITPPMYMRGDGEMEIEEIRDLYKGIKGKIPENGVF